MADPQKTESTNAVRRFDVNDPDGKRCKKWIRWAKSYLRSSTIPKEEWGNKLLTLLDGAAERATEQFDPDAISYDGSHLEIFQALQTRFPEREENDEVSEAATSIFTFKPEKNERVGLLVGRFQEAVAKGSTHGLTMSEKFQGWLLLVHRCCTCATASPKRGRCGRRLAPALATPSPTPRSTVLYLH